MKGLIMKKFLLLTVMLAAALLSGTEQDVIKTVRAYREAASQFDFAKTLAICSPDYEETTTAGTKLTYADLQEVGKSFEIIRNSNDLETLLVAAMKLQGQTMPAEQLKQIRAMKGTEQEKALIAGIRQQLNAMSLQAKALIANLQIIDCKISGSSAAAAQLVADPFSGKTIRTEYTLVKKDGKWLIRSIGAPKIISK